MEPNTSYPFHKSAVSPQLPRAMIARYKRVSQNDPEEVEESKKSRAERVEKISAKIHSLLWIIASVVVMVMTDMVNLIHSDKINRCVSVCVCE